MEQHPVPQQISSYEFRLVGDMTLKQFFQLAGGVAIALFFYASGLPFYFKWPLVLFFSFLGAAMAFLPFEERPLQTWIISFFKAVYSPTQFIWKKKPKELEFLKTTPQEVAQLAPLPVSRDKEKLTEYLKSLPAEKNPLDQREEGFLEEIRNLFAKTPVPQAVNIQTKPLEESVGPIGVRVQPPREPSPPFPEETPRVFPLPTAFPKPQPLRPPRKKAAAAFAQPAPKILFPSTPTTPNIIVGVVMDKEGKIVEGAIMEIRDAQGNPVRALRTNPLGQFRIATPLPNGIYEIETEKEGLIFDLVKIALKGEIVQPIEIRAK